jgi:hypothetical protein
MGLVEGQVIVAAEEDFGHGIDFVAVVLALFFGAQVVEAGADLGVAILVDGDSFGIRQVLYDAESMHRKFPGDQSGRYQAVSSQRIRSEGPHDGGFAATDTSGQ